MIILWKKKLFYRWGASIKFHSHSQLNYNIFCDSNVLSKYIIIIILFNLIILNNVPNITSEEFNLIHSAFLKKVILILLLLWIFVRCLLLYSTTFTCTTWRVHVKFVFWSFYFILLFLSSSISFFFLYFVCCIVYTS